MIYKNYPRWAAPLVFSLFLCIGNAAWSQTYHAASMRWQQMGFGAAPLSHPSISPGYAFGKNLWELAISAEVPVNAFSSQGKWAGNELFADEKIEAKRYLLKIRWRTRPEVGSLGYQVGMNYYRLDVAYKNPPVFKDLAYDSTLNIMTGGAGLFAHWEVNWKPISLIGAEMNVFSNFNTIDLWFEMKFVMQRHFKLGFVAEAIQPKPSLTNLYYGAYLEYVLRW